MFRCHIPTIGNEIVYGESTVLARWNYQLDNRYVFASISIMVF